MPAATLNCRGNATAGGREWAVDAEARLRYGQAGGTRRIAEQISRQLGWPIGHSSIARRVVEVVDDLDD